FDLSGESAGLLGRPTAIRIKAQLVLGKRFGQRAIALQFIFRRENATFQLVRTETARRFQRFRVGDQLLWRAYFPNSTRSPMALAAAARRIRVAEEQVRGERDALAEAAAQNFRHWCIPVLAEQVETRKFQRRKNLRLIVVERGGRVSDAEAKLFKASRIPTQQIGSQAAEGGFRGLAAAAHF